jgi:hypothetical protein
MHWDGDVVVRVATACEDAGEGIGAAVVGVGVVGEGIGTVQAHALCATARTTTRCEYL